MLCLFFTACNSPQITVNVNNPVPKVQALEDSWPTYLNNNARSGYDALGTITEASVSKLKLHWTDKEGSSISTQPVEVNGLIYWGSWDGFEHATAINGKQNWQTNLGKTSHSDCRPASVGVASTATVVPISINGKSVQAVLVGGGDANFYALDAAHGKILWKTALGSSSNQFIWSSPAVYKGSVYIGLASFADCPLVQGQFFQLNANTGAIEHVFNAVPTGCQGGTIWGSPAIDEAEGVIYIGTSENGTCPSVEKYNSAFLELRAFDLHLIGAWQIPAPQQTQNGDFGSTPTLFQATRGGVKVKMVGILNKNGSYYAFQRDALNKGPLWTATLAAPAACPDCGDGNISPAGWDGFKLYVAAGNIYVGDTKCVASLRALDPGTGDTIWQLCLMDGPVLGAVTMVPGMLIVGEGAHLKIISAASGHQLFDFTDASPHAIFYGAASVSLGVIYIGDSKGNLFALGS